MLKHSRFVLFFVKIIILGNNSLKIGKPLIHFSNYNNYYNYNNNNDNNGRKYKSFKFVKTLCFSKISFAISLTTTTKSLLLIHFN